MSLPSTHKAATLTGSTEDLKLVSIEEIKTIPPPADSLLVQVKANAFNPTDWKHPVVGWGSKGCVSGSDAAGIVVAVGSDVKGYSVGDHVSLFNHGGYTFEPTSGAFQEYVVASPATTIKYDSKLVSSAEQIAPAPVTTFEGAASITLGLVTIGLTFAHSFKLSFDKSQQKGKILLIWGGSGATGLLAIQIAKHVYGLDVYAVASKKNHALLKDLGADKTFDYHDADVVDQIKAAGGENIVYGFDTVSNAETLNQVHSALADKSPAVLENLLFLGADAIEKPRENVKITFSLAYLARGVPQNLGGNVLTPGKEMLDDYNKFWAEIVKYVNNGTIKHAPLRILDGGLNAVNEGLSLLRNDKVSGEKLIIQQ